jgi:hypothetical protein
MPGVEENTQDGIKSARPQYALVLTPLIATLKARIAFFTNYPLQNEVNYNPNSLND